VVALAQGMPLTNITSPSAAAASWAARGSEGTTKIPPLSTHPTSRAGSRAATAAAAAAAAAPSSSSSAASPLVVFPELSDQLLCAPDNVIWVYGQFALSFFATEATAAAKLSKKLRAMMREAQRHYEISRAYFCALTAGEQRAEVLRSALGFISSNANTNINGSSSSTNSNSGSGGTRRASRSPITNAAADTPSATSAAAAATSVEDSVFTALRQSWPTSSDAACVDGKGDGSTPYPPGLRVNLVLDIIASRKTLGAQPLRSRAYHIAEALYRRVMYPVADTTTTTTVVLGNRLSPARDVHRSSSNNNNNAAEAYVDTLRDLSPHVRAFIIGISDTDSTLVGRDVVCPYRHLTPPSPVQLRMRNTLEGLADVAAQRQQRQRFSASPSAARGGSAVTNTCPPVDAAADASMALAALVSRQLLLRHSVDALLPAPYTRVAPTLLSRLDQTRLILCPPPVDWSSTEEEAETT
jgi:hypothetical protein